MRAVVQRVDVANVKVGDQLCGQIGKGLLVLLGVAAGDTDKDLKYLVSKVTGLRIFEDEQGKMNLSVKDIGGSLLVVSQFTLLGDCRHGKRPSFSQAAEAQIADEFYKRFVVECAACGIPVETGVFRAHMHVSLVNNGPVTILLDSRA